MKPAILGKPTRILNFRLVVIPRLVEYMLLHDRDVCPLNRGVLFLGLTFAASAASASPLTDMLTVQFSDIRSDTIYFGGFVLVCFALLSYFRFMRVAVQPRIKRHGHEYELDENYAPEHVFANGRRYKLKEDDKTQADFDTNPNELLDSENGLKQLTALMVVKDADGDLKSHLGKLDDFDLLDVLHQVQHERTNFDDDDPSYGAYLNDLLIDIGNERWRRHSDEWQKDIDEIEQMRADESEWRPD